MLCQGPWGQHHAEECLRCRLWRIRLLCLGLWYLIWVSFQWLHGHGRFFCARRWQNSNGCRIVVHHLHFSIQFCGDFHHYCEWLFGYALSFLGVLCLFVLLCGGLRICCPLDLGEGWVACGARSTWFCRKWASTSFWRNQWAPRNLVDRSSPWKIRWIATCWRFSAIIQRQYIVWPFHVALPCFAMIFECFFWVFLIGPSVCVCLVVLCTLNHSKQKPIYHSVPFYNILQFL